MTNITKSGLSIEEEDETDFGCNDIELVNTKNLSYPELIKSSFSHFSGQCQNFYRWEQQFLLIRWTFLFLLFRMLGNVYLSPEASRVLRLETSHFDDMTPLLKNYCVTAEQKIAFNGNFVRNCKIERATLLQRKEPPLFFLLQELQKETGGPGHRSRYLSHAKRALYHLS